jgi:hypothetical protein
VVSRPAGSESFLPDVPTAAISRILRCYGVCQLPKFPGRFGRLSGAGVGFMAAQEQVDPMGTLHSGFAFDDPYHATTQTGGD